jgi:hypothetical protein
MKKIIFIFCFISFSCWSQDQKKSITVKKQLETSQYIPLDSLEKTSFRLSNVGFKNSINSSSKKIHTFLKVLDTQKKIRSIKSRDQEHIKAFIS